MKTGELIKRIRTEKKLTSKEVYRDIFTRPSIARFEKGESDTTTSKFFAIIDNLHISLDEYYFLYHTDEESVYLKVIERVLEVQHVGNGETFLNLEEEFLSKYKCTSKVVYLHYSCISHFLAHSYLSLPHPEKQLSVIMEYLFQIETWNYYELVLFNNSLDFLPHDFVDSVYKKVQSKMKKLQKIRRYKNELFSLITNILVTRIQAQHLENSKYYLNELKLNLSADNTRMYEKTMVIFFDELIKIMANPTEDRKKINSVISIFTFLEMENTRNQCFQLLEQVAIKK